MRNTLYFLEVIALIILITGIGFAFPGGTSMEVCDSLNAPRGHGLPLQPSDSPYVLMQTAISYKPGQVINVNIERLDRVSTYEGFVVQAVDKMTGRYIGRFLDADGLLLMDDCSAVTHANNRPKTAVYLAWVAPLNQRGDVIFRGTVIETKNKYYEGLVSRLESTRGRRFHLETTAYT